MTLNNKIRQIVKREKDILSVIKREIIQLEARAEQIEKTINELNELLEQDK